MKPLLFSLLLLFAYTNFAQIQGKDRVDSLAAQLPRTHSDTGRIRMLNEMAGSSVSVNADTGMRYAIWALALAQKINWQKGIAVANDRMGMCYAIKGQFKQALSNLLKSLELIKAVAPDDHTHLVEILHHVAYAYDGLNDTASASRYYLRWQDTLEKYYPPSIIANGYHEIAAHFYMHNDFGPAGKYWLRMLAIKDSLRDTTDLSSLLTNIALCFSKQNDHKAAIAIYNRAGTFAQFSRNNELDAFRLLRTGIEYTMMGDQKAAITYLEKAAVAYTRLKNGYMIGVTLENLGQIYQGLAFYPKALQCYQQAIDSGTKYNHSEDMLLAAALNDITIVYKAMKEYDRAIGYLSQSYRAYLDNKDTLSSLWVLCNMACIYGYSGRTDTALIIFKHVIERQADIGDNSGKAGTILNLADLYNNIGKYSEALASCKEALPIIDADGDLQGKAQCLATMGQAGIMLYKSTLRSPLLAQAKAHLQQCLALCAQTSNIETMQDAYLHLSDAQELEGDTKGALISYKNYVLYRDSTMNIDKANTLTRELLLRDYTKKEDSIKTQNEVRLALERQSSRNKMTIGGISAISALLLVSGGFYFYRKHEKDKLTLQLTATRQAALNAQMSDHFISNTMDSINHFIRHNDKDNASQYLVRFSRLVGKVLENAQEQLITIQQDLYVLQDYLELEKLRFTQHPLQYTIQVDTEVDAENTMIPPMVLQTLAENAIKHAFGHDKESLLQFTVQRLKNSIICTVEDNGTGRRLSSQHRQQPTRKSMGSGIAEQLVKTVSSYSRDTSYNITDLLASDGTPAGTRVSFTIPYIEAQ